MELLNHLRRAAIFVAVVDAGSFTQAATAVRLSKSQVSEQVSALEAHLGVRLLQRSPRSLRLTPEGTAFYAHARKMVSEAQAAWASLDAAGAPRGPLRITTTADLAATLLAPALSEFRKRYPLVIPELVLDDLPTDLIDAGIDVAVRVGPQERAAPAGTLLAETRLSLYASASHVSAHRAPARLSDLDAHDWIALTILPHGDELEFVKDSGEVHSFRPRPTYRTNSPLGMFALIESGAGIGLMPELIMRPALQRGSVVRILPSYSLPAIQIRAVYASDVHVRPGARAFVRVLEDWLARAVSDNHADAV